MANNSKYAAMGKDALTSEIKSRRAVGRKLSVDLRADEDTLRAALDTDDVENGEFPSATAEPEPPLAGSGNLGPKLPPTPPSEVGAAGQSFEGKPPGGLHSKGSLRNQLAPQAAAPNSQPTQPSEKEWEERGVLHRHKGDGLLYQVIKRDADDFNKPFKARVPAQETGHPGLFWEGGDAEFNDTFTKE